MRITNLFFLIFLMGAFAVGVALADKDTVLVDETLNNASAVIKNISLVSSIPEENTIPNAEGLVRALEYYLKFIGTFAIEVFRSGIHFGQENPDYFEPEAILYFMKWLVILALIGLLIKPAGYLIIFLVLIVMFISEKIKGRKKRRLAKRSDRARRGGK